MSGIFLNIQTESIGKSKPIRYSFLARIYFGREKFYVKLEIDLNVPQSTRITFSYLEFADKNQVNRPTVSHVQI